MVGGLLGDDRPQRHAASKEVRRRERSPESSKRQDLKAFFEELLTAGGKSTTSVGVVPAVVGAILSHALEGTLWADPLNEQEAGLRLDQGKRFLGGVYHPWRGSTLDGAGTRGRDRRKAGPSLETRGSGLDRAGFKSDPYSLPILGSRAVMGLATVSAIGLNWNVQQRASHEPT